MTSGTTAQSLQQAIQHHQAGRLAQAEALYRQVLAAEPQNAVALNLLGVLAHQAGHHAPAIELLRQAIALKPNYAEAHNNLGRILTDLGRGKEAATAFRAALSIDPNLAGAHNNLGIALKDAGRMDEALAAFRRAIELHPGFVSAYSNLANALTALGQTDAAIAAYQHALSLDPADENARLNLGTALKDKGLLDQSIACYREALRLNPNQRWAHSNLIYTMSFQPGVNLAALREELRRWDERFARPLKSSRPHRNDRNPDRRLRIGYVSPDLRDHVIGRNVLPLLREHEHAGFEITCYSNYPSEDEVTRLMRRYADRWHNIVGLSDENVTELIRGEQIDILVDLTLHLSDNRLLVFARQPAPIQAAFAAYPGSPGLQAYQYRITDPHIEPETNDDTFWPDRPIRLPHSFWCYEPMEQSPAVNALPALASGHVTFGCFNNFCKVNDDALRLWAQVMAEVKLSRLILMTTEGDHRQRTLRSLEQFGVAPQRIEFVSPRPRLKYLELYNRVDVGLDTVPYNGHTTSLDAMWMGVAVPTLANAMPLGRAGLCYLMNLKMPELIATSAGQFVRIHTMLCDDLPRLAKLRAGLRRRMLDSPLMDARGFARGIEAAYRTMWRTWCARRSGARG